MSGFNRLIKNSIANIINGFSNVILGIVISPFLLHRLPVIDFSIWSLALQAGILIGIIGFGLQVTVGRFVALHVSDIGQIKKIILNSQLFAAFLAIITLFVVILIDFSFLKIFTDIPQSYAEQARLTMLLICGSFIINNLCSSYIGYFIGLERNDITAVLNVFFKTILGVGVVLTAKYGILTMAVTYFIINVINQLALFILYKNKTADAMVKVVRDYQLIRNIAYFYAGLLIWNVAQFLISGIGTFTVGKFSFNELAEFAVIMTLVNAVVGVVGAISNPIIQPIIRLHTAGRANCVEKLVTMLSAAFALTIFIGVTTSSYLAIYILRIWLGHDISAGLDITFTALLATYLIRMIAAPYGMMLVAYGKQLSISHLPLLEGLLNFLLSIYFVRQYGAIGIAYSTAISGISLMSYYAVKFFRESETKPKEVFASFICIPLLMALFIFYLRTVSNTYSLISIYIIQIVLVVIFSCCIIMLAKKIKLLLNTL
ncbi:flippase [Cronobacter sakazakii]|uniref:flippase n=1 Tax=Cronobacter sakazakii TaxID=28141 RepID=UPI000DA12256|nr:flippase [Cronobacter sakazakii]